MVEQAVCTEILVNRSEHRIVLQCPTCTAHAGCRIDYYPSRLNQSLTHKRCKCKTRRSHITARCRDQSRALQLRTVHLGQTINGLRNKFWTRMLEAVPRWILRWIGESKSRRQIDYQTHFVDKLRHDLQRCLMRQSQEDDIAGQSPTEIKFFKNQIWICASK